MTCACGQTYGDVTRGWCRVCERLRAAGLPPMPAGSYDGTPACIRVRHAATKRAWDALHPKGPRKYAPCACGEFRWLRGRCRNCGRWAARRAA